MKRLLLAASALALLGGVVAARAETLQLPSDAPVATVTFPDGWATEETETGAQSFSDDDAVTLYVDLASGESVEQVVADAATFMVDNGVTVDTATEQRSEGQMNGLPATSVAWKGTDESGAVDIALTAVQVSDEAILVITYWAAEGAGETHAAELEAIAASVAPVAQ